MKRILLILVVLWTLLLGTELCLAGAHEHPCMDCSEGISCDHEEAGTADSCGKLMLRRDDTSMLSALGEVAELPADTIELESSNRDSQPLLHLFLPPERDNLSPHPSDLPLLN